jgi:glucose/arabinose dehydrogenase
MAMHSPILTALVALTLCGCYNLRPSTGGGQTTSDGSRAINPLDVAVPDGYRVEAIASGFTYPTGVAFDSAGVPYVTESGYSYGEDFTEPRLIRVSPDGRKKTIFQSKGNGPWTGVTYASGAFYIAEGGATEGGRILRVTPGGKSSVLISRLPSVGDHHTNGPAIGPDGWVYFGQGTATNSGVVGNDNLEFGWLKRHPQFHDIPGEDIVLTGQNFTSPNRLTGQGTVKTGAFLPYGTPGRPGQLIKGRVPSSGSVMRIPPGGGAPQLVAWGFRNPFGLAFSPDGKLYVTENGYDDRGSRPVWGTPDVLWEVRRGAWYGWPDYSAGEPLTKKDFKPPGKQPLQFLLANKKTPPAPVAKLGVHSSANGLDFAWNHSFGHAGEAFIALFGDQAPATGKVTNPVGYKIVRVNVKNGAVEDFAVNRGRKQGPASLIGAGGLERPIAARFNPAGTALYVVDFGIMTMSQRGPRPVRETGVLWKITRQ